MIKELPELLEDERLDEVNEQIRLIQKKKGLTFGTDAFLLSAFVRPQPCARAVDLGSGTGIIPLLLCARDKVATVTAVELQTSFAELIERNVALNGFDGRITVLNRNVQEINAATLGAEVELVVSNPPYLTANAGKTNRDLEKELARHEICGTVFDFCAAASRLLKTKGRFACVWRAERLADLLTAMRENRLEPKRMTFVHSDVASPPCMVLTEAVKDAAPSLKVTPPLFLYETNPSENGTRTLTRDAALVYEACAFPIDGK